MSSSFNYDQLGEPQIVTCLGFYPVPVIWFKRKWSECYAVDCCSIETLSESSKALLFDMFQVG